MREGCQCLTTDSRAHRSSSMRICSGAPLLEIAEVLLGRRWPFYRDAISAPDAPPADNFRGLLAPGLLIFPADLPAALLLNIESALL